MDPRSAQRSVLVTGGSGFVASHCILALHHAGYAVRATLRSLGRASAVAAVLQRAQGAPVPVDWTVADLMDDAGWAEAVSGVDYVLHVASPFPRTAPKTARDLIEPARAGTVRVLEAAARAGVKRVVMTSSIAAITYGRGNMGRPYTEQDWSDAEGADNSFYTRSKTYAERAAWDFMAKNTSGMELVTLNPGAILGPVLDQDYGTSPAIVLKLLKGDFPGMPRMGFPLVDVRDVAALHVQALSEPAAAGQRFLCASDFMWVEEIAAVLREHLPAYAKKMPARRLPNWLVRVGALFDPMTRGVVFELGIRRDCDCRRVRTVFNYEFRSGREAIIATADTLRSLALV